MKKSIYIAAFTLLGVMVSFLVHALLEIPALYLVTNHYETYGDSLWWQHWELVHGGISVLLLVLGVLLGFWQGRYWWQVLYVEGRYRRAKSQE